MDSVDEGVGGPIRLLYWQGGQDDIAYDHLIIKANLKTQKFGIDTLDSQKTYIYVYYTKTRIWTKKCHKAD